MIKRKLCIKLVVVQYLYKYMSLFVFAGVLGSGGMLIIITTALITVGFIIIKRKHASKKAGEWGVN